MFIVFLMAVSAVFSAVGFILGIALNLDLDGKFTLAVIGAMLGMSVFLVIACYLDSVDEQDEHATRHGVE